MEPKSIICSRKVVKTSEKHYNLWSGKVTTKSPLYAQHGKVIKATKKHFTERKSGKWNQKA
jgi:hypothetical protein